MDSPQDPVTEELGDSPCELRLRKDNIERLFESQDLRTLEVAVDRTQHQLDELQELHSRLRAHLELVSSLAAPIRRISEDILRQILICRWSDTNERDRPLFTLCVASVCRAWREAVIDASVLWSTIPVDIALPPPSALPLFVEHSRSRGLEIHINYLHSDSDSEEDSGSSPDHDNVMSSRMQRQNLTAVLKLLVPHLTRWKSLSISLPFIDLKKEVLASMRGPADLLEELVIYSRGKSNPLPADLFPAHFKAPRLTMMLLDSWQLPKTLVFQSVLPALRALRLTRPKVPNRMSLMQALGPLRHLRCLELICPEFDNISAVDYFPRVPLVNLKKLLVIALEPGAVRALLSSFSAPRMARFNYIHPIFDNSEVPLVMEHPQAFPSLHTILIDARCSYPPSMGAVSRWTQDFQCAHINLVKNHDHIKEFVACARNMKDRLFFPGLSSVIIHSENHVTVKLLRDLVRARGRAAIPSHLQGCDSPSATLKELEVYTRCRLCPQDNEWFKNNLESFSWSFVETILDDTIILSFAPA
ncbi:hypothetical protein BKA93DRAFT_828071 [Sparassis latifolia]|uniref:F-box domain-containing protein n=1 Tax=Sparassis crispa TaxID=139825 RepID=A0A401H4S9_9APHY|nr:hypothetical protein SCP_1600990 [Sparassis crispa]GBE89437.1 hypothetical protein SCP_1600990 [Sparassis crispa]